MDSLGLNGNCKIHGMPPPPPPPHVPSSRASQHPLLRSSELPENDIEVEGDVGESGGTSSHRHCWSTCPEVSKAVEGVRFIAEHTRREEESIRVFSLKKLLRQQNNYFSSLYCQS